MSNPTSNFNWQMPTNTDLVTDLPADFEVFGQAVDTSLADLKGGTSGQILSKNSNTDMDFVWVSANPGDITGVTAGTGISGGGTSGDVTITNSMATAIDAKGDVIVGTGADAFSRLAVGTNNQVLTADSSTATGLKWATPAAGGGGKILQVVSTTYSTQASSTSTSYADSGLTLSITPSASTSRVVVFVSQPIALIHTQGQELYMNMNVVRGSTQLMENRMLFRAAAYGSESAIYTAWAPTYVDSPATTSSTTYKCQFKNSGAVGTAYTQIGNTTATITLMEIGA